jgi:hypothetical protein
MRLDGQRRPLAGAAWTAAARECSHLPVHVHVRVHVRVRVRVHVHVHVRVRVRVHVHVQCMCMCSDARHLLGRPDLGGGVVVLDVHVLFLPRVPHLVRARPKGRVKVRAR